MVPPPRRHFGIPASFTLPFPPLLPFPPPLSIPAKAGISSRVSGKFRESGTLQWSPVGECGYRRRDSCLRRNGRGCRNGRKSGRFFFHPLGNPIPGGKRRRLPGISRRVFWQSRPKKGQLDDKRGEDSRFRGNGRKGGNGNEKRIKRANENKNAHAAGNTTKSFTSARTDTWSPG